MSGSSTGVAIPPRDERRGGRGRRSSSRAFGRAVPFALLTAVILPVVLSAQEDAPDCSPLIAAVDSVTSVDQLTGSWLQATRESVDPALTDLVPAFARMRRYELRFEHVDSYEAATAFRRILRRQSRLACAHYGLGRTLARGPDALVRLGDGAGDYGPVPYSLAAIQGPRELRRALELDSTLVDAAAELFRMAAELHHPPIAEAAREATPLVAARLRTAPPLLLGIAGLESYDGDPDSAAALIEGAPLSRWNAREREQAARVLVATGHPGAALPLIDGLASGGRLSGSAFYLKAQALLALPGRAEEGAAAYLEGLARADSAGLEPYLEDAEPLLGDRLADWREEGIDSFKARLRWWWEQSAALSAVRLDERLAEHYRRLAVARRKYPLRSSLGAPDPLAVVLDVKYRKFRVDQRGLVYIRQGEPMRTFGNTEAGGTSEAWLYPRLGGGTDIYYFRWAPGQTDWQMIPVGCAVPQSLLETLAAWDHELAIARSQCMGGGLGAAEVQKRALQQALRTWPATGDRRHLDDNPVFAADFYALRGRTGTALTTVVGVEGSSLVPAGSADDPVYSSDAEMIVIDSARRTVERATASDSMKPGHRLTPVETVRQYITTEVAPARSADYRIAVTDAVSGNSRMAGGPLEIPDFSGDSLMLSGLVIATADSGNWKRGDVALSLVPGRVFTSGARMYVYFEIYNQPVDTAFSVEVTLRARERRGVLGRIAGLFGGERDENTIRYDDIARAADPLLGIQQLRTLGTNDLAPGDYTLTVTITDPATGRSVSRNRDLTLREAPGG